MRHPLTAEARVATRNREASQQPSQTGSCRLKGHTKPEDYRQEGQPCSTDALNRG